MELFFQFLHRKVKSSLSNRKKSSPLKKLIWYSSQCWFTEGGKNQVMASISLYVWYSRTNNWKNWPIVIKEIGHLFSVKILLSVWNKTFCWILSNHFTNKFFILIDLKEGQTQTLSKVQYSKTLQKHLVFYSYNWTRKLGNVRSHIKFRPAHLQLWQNCLPNEEQIEKLPKIQVLKKKLVYERKDSI